MKKLFSRMLLAFSYHSKKTLMFSMCCMFSYVNLAQSSESANRTKENPVAGYLEKYKDSQLVKQYFLLPGDQDLAALVKISTILDNIKYFPEYTQEDLNRMRSQQKQGMEMVTFIDKQVGIGMTYEKAKVSYQRQITVNNSRQQQPATQNSEPALFVPGQ